MVAPERETPGIRASAWASPSSTACFIPTCLRSRSCLAVRSATPSTSPITIRVVAMIHRLRKSCSITSLSEHPEHDDRHRADDHVPAHPRVDVPAELGLEDRLDPGRADPPDVVTEVEQDRQLGADLDHRRERCAGVTPAEPLRQDPEVGAAGDGKELGEALDEPEHHSLKEVEHRHSVRIASCLLPDCLPRRAACRWLGCGRYRFDHAAAASGRHRTLGVAPGPGHDDLGPRHRRARGARAAGRLRRRRRHARGHRRGLHRRRLRAVDRFAARRRLRPRRGRDRHQGRRRATRLASGSRTPRAAT